MFSIELWILALTKPKETFANFKAKVTWMDAIVPLLIVGVIGGFINGLVTMMTVTQAINQLNQMGLPVAALGVQQFGILTAVTSAIVTPIALVIGMFILAAIVFVIAQSMGGKGDFMKQFYLQSVFSCPLYLIISAANALILLGQSFVMISGLVSLLAGLYGLYGLYLLAKAVHSI